SNQLTTVPESITKLVNLTQLDLRSNQLTTVPESITKLVNLTLLYLDDNPLEDPPLEIAKKGIIAIREFFQHQEEEHDRLYEAKLLIVGEAGAGKTTLSEKICDSNYQLKEEDSTKGIEVKTWSFTMANGEEFRVNIWDFGGQEIYHATHQFFLTKRSLYLLVTDTRKEDTDFFYWLNVVELLSDNSPIFIVQNEKQDRHREINARILRGQFKNLKEILPTNLANNRGLENILREIKHQIENLPHVGSRLPKTWTTIRSILEKDTRDYINIDEYFRICDENKITKDSSKLLLSSYLHDLGVFLHFQNDPLLKNKVILKPEWGTTAVYKVLDNPQAIRNFGKFTRQELKEIWKEAQYNNMRDELLQLMIKFKLCYPLPRTEDTYIAPQLLTLNPPEYDWNDNNNLILRYEYEFMPKGILTQFIVALHRNIHQKPNKQQCVWRTGVILDKDNTQAEVIEDRDRRTIKIRITGKYKRDLMTIIIHELEEIHHAFNRLKYKLLIPCNCTFCKDSQDPEFYPFEVLRQFERDGKDIQCRKSYNTVNVRSLINNAINRREIFEEERERKRNSSTNIDININTGDNSMSSDRIIKMGSGDYHEREIDNKGVYIEGDYNSQQDLTAAASEIQQLLTQLSQNAPTTNTVEQMQIATQAIQQIESDPSLKEKAIAAFKGGFLEGIKNTLIGSVVAGAIEGWTNAGN
ncbi:MAG: GTPase, partial [Cyanobacteria bacterium SBLK]|nr:GTPase [Cyanobacteria bacterium SBLK]